MNQKVKEVSPSVAYEKIQNGALLVDIREAEEIEMVAFDMGEQMLIPHSEFSYRFLEVPRDREVILGCHSGNRSLNATLFLIEQNFDNIYNLKGGISDWIDMELPVKWDNYKTENNLQVHKI
jgi:rhodanese-related sulfurtransferase